MASSSGVGPDVGTRPAPWMVAGLFLLAGGVFYLPFFNAFTVPKMDFFGLHWNAVQYLHCEPPYSFKRLPLFSLLIGVVAFVMPGPEPILAAAEVINAVLAPMSLWLIYRIGRRFHDPRASLMLTALCAADPVTVYCVAQPLHDILHLTLVLSTVDCSLRGSRWAYLWAGLASLTRYEAVVLIPILMIHDGCLRLQPDARGSMLRGVLASVGIVTWMALSVSFHRGAINPHWGEFWEPRRDPMAFLKGIFTRPLDFLPPSGWDNPPVRLVVVAATLAVFGVGLLMMIRRYQSDIFVMGVFFCAYIAIHTLYPWFQMRRVLPVMWIFYLVALKGFWQVISALIRISGPVPIGSMWRGGRWVWLISLAAACLYASITLLEQEPLAMVSVMLFVLGMVLREGWGKEGGIRGWNGGRVSFLLLLGIVLGSGAASSAHLMRSDQVRNHMARLRSVAEWYRNVAKPGDAMLVPIPRVIDYYGRLPRDYFVYPSSLESSTIMELLKELRDRGVTYVLWDSDHGSWDETGYYLKRFKSSLITLLRNAAPPGMLEPCWERREGALHTVVYRIRFP